MSILKTQVNHFGVEGHIVQVPRCTNSDDHVKSFYSQELAEIVMKIYEDDYKLLGIPHPSWINEMTGELAHEVAKVLAQCPAKSRSA